MTRSGTQRKETMAWAWIDSRPWKRGSTRASAELTERPSATTRSTTEREIASASSSRPVFRFRATRTERRPVTGSARRIIPRSALSRFSARSTMSSRTAERSRVELTMRETS